MFPLIIFSIAVVLLCFRLWRANFKDQGDLHILPLPRDKPTLVFGHELMIWKHQASELMMKWAYQLGPIYRIKCAFGHPDIIIVTDHAAVNHLSQFTDLYGKSPAFLPLISSALGRGVLWAEGENHKKQRRLIAPAFSTDAVKGMADDVLDCSQKLEKSLVHHVTTRGGGTVINVLDHITTCALDIIGRVGFNHDFELGNSDDAKHIRESWDGIVQFGVGYGGFFAPLIVRTFPSIASLALQSHGKVRQIVSRLSMRLVERGALSNDARDILSILLRANKGAECDRLTTEQVVDNITTFTMVGSETSAGVLAYTMLELACHPDKQTRLRDEVREFNRDITYDNINELVYLDAVVMEGLRVHPSSPVTERVALKDDVIPLKRGIRDSSGKVVQSIRVKAGQVFHIQFRAMNMDKDVWGENASQFIPERWITPDGVPPKDQLPSGWKGIMTFHAGPRNCLGYRLAVFELKVMLATIIRSLEFHKTETDIKSKIAQTLQPVVDGRGGVMPLYVTLASGA